MRASHFPLRTRFAWIAIATLCTLLLKEVWQTSVPLIAVSVMNADPRTLGLLVATETLPLVLLGLAVGAWVDRLGPAITLGLAQAGQLTVLSIGLFLCTRHDLSGAILAMFPFVFFVGLHSMLFDVSLLSVTPTLVDPARLPWANKVQAVCQSLAEISGPILAGSVLAAAGPRGITALLLALCAPALVICLLVARAHRSAGPATETGAAPAQVPAGRLAGVRSLAQSPLLRAVVFNSLAWNMFYGMLLPIFVSGISGLGQQRELTVSVAFSANGAGFLAGGLASGWLVARLGVARSILAAKSVAAIVGLALLPLTRMSDPTGVVAVAAVVFFVFGMVVATSQISSVSIRQASIPRPFLGRAMAAFRVATWIGIPLGSIVGGDAVHRFGVFGALALALGLNIVCTALLFRSPLFERDPLAGSSKPTAPTGAV